MAQCFRDLGEAGHTARYAHRSLDMDGRYPQQDPVGLRAIIDHAF